MMRSLSNASGQGVAKASHDSMIASDMSNYTRIIAHSYAKVAESHLHGLMPSIVIVRYTSLYTFLTLVLIVLCSVRSEGGSGCAKAQELSPEQQGVPGSLKADPDADGKDGWNSYGNGPVLM